MLGLGGAEAGAPLVAGLIYKPYYLVWMGIALAVAFFGVQTWDFTRRITWPRLTVILGGFAAAVVLLTTQAYNPFLYFIF